MHLLRKLSSLVSTSSMSNLDREEDYISSSASFLLALSGSAVIYGPEPDGSLPLASVERGGLYFISPRTPVRIVPADTILIYAQYWDPLMLLDILDEGIFLKTSAYFSYDHPLTQCFLRYTKACTAAGSSSDAQKAMNILPLIAELAKPDSAGIPLQENATGVKQAQFIGRVISYIHENFRDNLSLNQMADEFQVTPQYFASCFKKYTGSTFLKYLQNLRCRKGCLYLAFTALTAEQASERVRYKEPEILENEYKAHLSEFPAAKEILRPAPVGSFVSEKRLPFLLSELSGQPAENSSDAPADSPRKELLPECAAADILKARNYQHVWKSLINLGYATEFHGSEILKQISRAKKDFKFQYGRICRLMDLIVCTSESEERYDYTMAFRILDFMIEKDILPFIELSNKLFRIQLDSLQNIPKNTAHNFDDYFKRIVRIMPGFIRACINRYGISCFRQWRFEFSYSEDDFKELSENVTFFKYVQYFRQIGNIIKHYSPDTLLGAPGFNRLVMPRRLNDVLDIFSSNQALPDFITLYYYPVDVSGSSISISPDENLFEKRIRPLADLIHAQYPDMEIWITEFNSNMSSRNFLNDSDYQSNFLIHNMSEAIDCGVAAVAYYQLSDILLRYSDNLDFLFGGWGLITDRGIPKPSWHALHFLSLLGKQLLYRDKDCMITCNNNRQFQCLLHHYQHIRPEISKRNVSYREFEYPEAIFTPVPAKNITIEIQHALPGTYLIKKYLISGNSGNVLHEWKKTGYMNLSGKHEVSAVAKCSELLPELSTQAAGKGQSLSFSLELKNHDIYMLLIDLII